MPNRCASRRLSGGTFVSVADAPLAVRQPSRRLLELSLLIFAWAIGVLGVLQVAWATGEGVTTRLWITVSVVGLLALASHAVVLW